LFGTLRKKVLACSEEELSDKLKYVSLKGSGLPIWWKPIVHDKALLRGVARHGYGKWEEMCSDPTLPFRDLAFERMKSPSSTPVEPVHTTEPSKDDEDSEGGETCKDTDDAKEIKNETDKSTSPKSKKGKKPPGKFSMVLDMPKDKVLLKRLQYLIKTVMDSSSRKLLTSQLPLVSNTSKLKQTTLPFVAGGSSLLSNEEELDDFQNSKQQPKAKRKHDSGNETEKKERKRRKINPETRSTGTGRGRKFEVKRDEDGNVVLPLKLGVLTVENLGRVIFDNLNFHSEKYIWPLGYKSSREYTSTKDISQKCKYHCEILEMNNKPFFKVIPEDDPDNPVMGYSASKAWKQILDRVNSAKKDEAKRSSVSGPEYFGYGNRVVADVISKLPGADRCLKYKGTKKKRQKTPKNQSTKNHHSYPQLTFHTQTIPIQNTNQPVLVHNNTVQERLPVVVQHDDEWRWKIPNKMFGVHHHLAPTHITHPHPPSHLPQLSHLSFHQTQIPKPIPNPSSGQLVFPPHQPSFIRPRPTHDLSPQMSDTNEHTMHD